MPPKHLPLTRTRGKADCAQTRASPGAVRAMLLSSSASELERKLYAAASTLSPGDHASLSSTSLCGEQVKKETGFFSGLYYTFYASSAISNSGAVPSDAPVILWLSGGPGCSGLVGGLFELGPCIFDDEANRISFTPHSWTSLAHVIFLDQPRGTGFSDPDADKFWTHEESVQDMAAFLNQFFLKHPELATNDFYIFGESYGSHYVPDLAQHLLRTDAARWTSHLKGIGIGNGVVSSRSIVDSFVDFAASNTYDKDLLEPIEAQLGVLAEQFVLTSERCDFANSPHQQLSLRSNSASDCDDAVNLFQHLNGLAVSAVTGAGWNEYDMRRECHADDRVGLCYHFSRLEDFVNQQPLCSADLTVQLQQWDFLEVSEVRVAYLLDQGVRVLVYGGDADTVVNWKAQNEWTRQLKWSNQQAFNDAPLASFSVNGQQAGRCGVPTD